MLVTALHVRFVLDEKGSSKSALLLRHRRRYAEDPVEGPYLPSPLISNKKVCFVFIFLLSMHNSAFYSDDRLKRIRCLVTHFNVSFN